MDPEQLGNIGCCLGAVAYLADHLLVLLRVQFAGASKVYALLQGGGQLRIAFVACGASTVITL